MAQQTSSDWDSQFSCLEWHLTYHIAPERLAVLCCSPATSVNAAAWTLIQNTLLDHVCSLWLPEGLWKLRVCICTLLSAALCTGCLALILMADMSSLANMNIM